MALKINNTNVTALKLGASNVVKAYLGNNLLFQSVLTPSEMILSTSGGIIQKVDKNTWNVIQSSSLRDMASDSSLLVITGVSDENFIYLASANRERIYKIARNDLSLVGTTPLFGVTLVTSIVQDEEHIYVFASATHSTLGAGKKYSKNTLNLVSTGPSTTNRVSNATLDNGILYLGRTSIRGI